MKRKAKRLELGREVITVTSPHAHVTAGMKGTIEQILPDGYAVYYPATIHQGSFGGGKEYKPAIVAMGETDIAYTEPAK